MDERVELPAGTYRLGEPGAERAVTLRPVLIGRFPVVNSLVAQFVGETGRAVAPALARKLADPQLADHPATDLTYDEGRPESTVAAERQQIHPNTAQYRLRCIEERSGRNPRRLADLLDLLVAIALDDAA